MAERIKLGGLWLNKSKDGREYLTGKLSPTVKILIFKNDFKNADNQPSHVMYLAPIETDEASRGAPAVPAPSSFFGGDADDLAADDPDAAAEARPSTSRPPAAGPRPSPPASRGGRPRPGEDESAAAAPDDLDDPFAQ